MPFNFAVHFFYTRSRNSQNKRHTNINGFTVYATIIWFKMHKFTMAAKMNLPRQIPRLLSLGLYWEMLVGGLVGWWVGPQKLVNTFQQKLFDIGHWNLKCCRRSAQLAAQGCNWRFCTFDSDSLWKMCYHFVTFGRRWMK